MILDIDFIENIKLKIVFKVIVGEVYYLYIWLFDGEYNVLIVYIVLNIEIFNEELKLYKLEL